MRLRHSLTKILLDTVTSVIPTYNFFLLQMFGNKVMYAHSSRGMYDKMSVPFMLCHGRIFVTTMTRSCDKCSALFLFLDRFKSKTFFQKLVTTTSRIWDACRLHHEVNWWKQASIFKTLLKLVRPDTECLVADIPHSLFKLTFKVDEI